MAVRTIIPGPPGTGKTYRLVNHYLSNEINSLQTSAQRIIYITFSKAAAKEARERIEELFPNQDFLYIKIFISTLPAILVGFIVYNYFIEYFRNVNDKNIILMGENHLSLPNNFGNPELRRDDKIWFHNYMLSIIFYLTSNYRCSNEF